ncbi:hypothetical protein ACFLT7_01945 [candidate division KSB1 bacterium]
MTATRHYLSAPLIAALILAACAGREAIEPTGAADVQLVGDPVKQTLASGLYVILGSFDIWPVREERVMVNPSYAILAVADPDSLDRIAEAMWVEESKPARPGTFLWSGLVRNYGDTKADNVYVRIRFAGGRLDSAYVRGHHLNPNETAAYNVYSVGGQVDRTEVQWAGKDSVDA